MGVSTQPEGMDWQFGSRETAVSASSSLKLLKVGAVGVPLAKGMAGSGVLVGVAFRLVKATATGEGKICCCKPSNCASSKAKSSVKNRPPLMRRWVRQLPAGIVSLFMRCRCVYGRLLGLG